MGARLDTISSASNVAGAAKDALVPQLPPLRPTIDDIDPSDDADQLDEETLNATMVRLANTIDLTKDDIREDADGNASIQEQSVFAASSPCLFYVANMDQGKSILAERQVRPVHTGVRSAMA